MIKVGLTWEVGLRLPRWKSREIPHAQRGCQFEEQLKEIDAAIFGATTDTTNLHHTEQSKGMTEVIQTNGQSSHAQMNEEDAARHNGPQEELNKNLMTPLGPQMHNGPTNKAQVNFITPSPFIMGPTSPSNSIKPKQKKSSQVTSRKAEWGRPCKGMKMFYVKGKRGWKTLA